ncbi:hypothetical protein [Natronorubrum sp. DTA28]|uniref:hypothetical protein n=1 Tax=Natronorubrum sp. DTA28 TaxID=3447019 RepID=UPI003F869811
MITISVVIDIEDDGTVTATHASGETLFEHNGLEAESVEIAQGLEQVLSAADDLEDVDTLYAPREEEAWMKTREMTYEEAADEMGITLNTLERHLEERYKKPEKARENLKQALKTLGWFESGGQE